VRHPFNQVDDDVADLFLGEEQGRLIAFRGSDAERLRNGNAALQEVVEKYGFHPLASYARMVKGYNLSREFKTLLEEGKVRTRPMDLARADAYFEPMMADFESGRTRMDNVTFGRAVRRWARGQVEQGDRKRAKGTLHRLERALCARREVWGQGPFKAHVLRTIRKQARKVLLPPAS
jgi:hypothetical protein